MNTHKKKLNQSTLNRVLFAQVAKKANAWKRVPRVVRCFAIFNTLKKKCGEKIAASYTARWSMIACN